jgi:hypothetical protein
MDSIEPIIDIVIKSSFGDGNITSAFPTSWWSIVAHITVGQHKLKHKNANVARTKNITWAKFCPHNSVRTFLTENLLSVQWTVYPSTLTTATQSSLHVNNLTTAPPVRQRHFRKHPMSVKARWADFPICIYLVISCTHFCKCGKTSMACTCPCTSA